MCRQRTVRGMQPYLPPLDCLLAALAVSRTGSFSGAAEELGVTHAAVSRRVAGAESWASLAIFRRHARGAVLTPEGERLLSRVSQGLELIDRAADRGRKVRRPSTVRLATTPSFTNHWLLDRLGALEAAAGARASKSIPKDAWSI
jgi:LysR family transcriptional regulator, glycine cleavage system transcriptional activator